jgi:hypothetical protein
LFRHIGSLFSKLVVGLKILLFLVFAAGTVYFSSTIYKQTTDEFYYKVYSTINQNILKTTKLIVQQKQDAARLAALSLSTNPALVDIIFGKRYVDLAFDSLTKNLKQYTNFKNIWFSVIDLDGNIMKHSWSNANLKNISHIDYINEILTKHKPKTILTIDKFGLVISNFVPIYYDGDFVGILNLMIQFDTIVEELKK